MHEQILIVDDEHDTIELLRYNLQKANYVPLIARNGEEAITAVQCCAPEVILLDVMMPGLNGWEVCRILRQSSKGEFLPIIMLSALSDEEARVKGLSVGADDYVSKPFSIKELMLKIQKLIDRQHALKQLHAREQEQETSLRYLVHEMKNSLTVIGGFSSLALKKDENHAHLKTIHTAAVHAQSLLNDTSLLSRLEKEPGSLPTEATDIVELAKEVVEMFRDMAKKKRLEIVDGNNDPLLVRANKTAARQVLVNLLSNAVKFSREGGRIWISFEEADSRVEVTIKDEGCGVPRDELSHIFNKFYRAAGSEQVKGAGLGLHIVKLLTESMEGKIIAESEQGSGSSFTVSLLEARATASPLIREVA
jgi:two-component system sensor histidine kinase/response regulator